MTALTQDTSMPTREGDLSIEGHGMDPIPESARYGSVGRVFTVWFTPKWYGVVTLVVVVGQLRRMV